MKEELPLSLVRGIMEEFAERTGLAPAGRSPRRYLWTDAFGGLCFSRPSVRPPTG